MLELVVSSWYMTDKNWLKNVNKLRANSRVGGGISSTIHLAELRVNVPNWVQTLFIQLDLPIYSTKLYTYLNNKINLLNKSFTYYPQRLLMSPLKEY